MRAFVLLLLATASAPSFAALAPATPLPEPGTLELLSIGAIAAVVMLIRNRRK